MLTNLLENHVLTYFLIFSGIVIFSYLTNSLFLRFVHTLGIRKMDAETIIRWGPKSKPALGGFNFYLAFLLCIASNSLIFDPNQFFLNKEFIGLLLCVTLGFMIGLADDAYDTKPLLKLTGQLSCGTILVLTNNSISLTPSDLLNAALTLLWVVGIMNSINMIDNMDGIASIVSLSILTSCMILVYNSGHAIGSIYFIVMIGSAASLVAFLLFNWNPSKMYMGDTGSQFLGALISALSVLFLWNYRSSPSEVPDLNLIFRNFILVALAFLMPIIDTIVVVINRLRAGHSPFVGGKDHTTHNIARLGLSDRSVGLVFVGIGFFSCFLVFLVLHFGKVWQPVHSLIFGSVFILSLCSFFVLTHRGQKLNKKKSS